MPRSPFHAAILPPGFVPGEPALVGVSGGRDSVALLHWLRSAGCERLVVCHLDHGLRPESREEARFVRSLAARWGCECAVSRGAVKVRAERTKRSLEAAAREARLAFFTRCARKFRTSRLFLAHHADDQVETFLFNLLRGAGPGGWGGMSMESQLGSLGIARPLLGVWREEIDAYCAAHQLEWREDASNVSRAHTRNRLRHDALPALSAAMGRDVRKALWRAAELQRAEDEVVREVWAAREAGAGDESARKDLSGDGLLVKDLRSLPLALQRRRIHGWLIAEGVPEVGFEEVESVRSLLDLKIAKINLPGKRHARRKQGRIFLE